jgi:hypothetical protein
LQGLVSRFVSYQLEREIKSQNHLASTASWYNKDNLKKKYGCFQTTTSTRSIARASGS